MFGKLFGLGLDLGLVLIAFRLRVMLRAKKLGQLGLKILRARIRIIVFLLPWSTRVHSLSMPEPFQLVQVFHHSRSG